MLFVLQAADTILTSPSHVVEELNKPYGRLWSASLHELSFQTGLMMKDKHRQKVSCVSNHNIAMFVRHHGRDISSYAFKCNPTRHKSNLTADSRDYSEQEISVYHSCTTELI